jgi:hypothetical protein
LQEQQRRASSKSIKFTGKSYYYKVRGALWSFMLACLELLLILIFFFNILESI